MALLCSALQNNNTLNSKSELGRLVVVGGGGGGGEGWGSGSGGERTSYHHGVLGNQSHGLRALIGQLVGHLQVDGGALRVGFGDGCGDHGDGGRALRQD